MIFKNQVFPYYFSVPVVLQNCISPSQQYCKTVFLRPSSTAKLYSVRPCRPSARPSVPSVRPVRPPVRPSRPRSGLMPKILAKTWSKIWPKIWPKSGHADLVFKTSLYDLMGFYRFLQVLHRFYVGFMQVFSYRVCTELFPRCILVIFSKNVGVLMD